MSDFLQRRKANHQPLSPLTFLQRAGSVYPNKLAIVHGRNIRRTWGQYYDRVIAVASGLKGTCGVSPNDKVAVMLNNTPEMLEMHFASPLLGACLCSINTRLDPAGVSFILEHSEAVVFIWDAEYDNVVKEALSLLSADAKAHIKYKIKAIDSEYYFEENKALKYDMTYDDLHKAGSGPSLLHWSHFPGPTNEWDDIALNYTSGTTGNPKGVLLHHRGAYLNSIGNILSWSLGTANQCVLLWTLPMFHCNGWCFPWTIAAVAGTHVCLRNVNAKNIFDAIKAHKVSHFCGAPIIMQMIINATDAERQSFEHSVSMMTAAAPPPAPVLAAMKEQNIEITHVYGLSEVYGPAVVCSWHNEWNLLDSTAQASKKSRQGVRYPVLEGLMVADPETLVPVPRDGKTIGEIFMQGNIVMKGYLKNQKATEEAFAGGWFHTGDLAVIHEDGYVQIADRSKDIIISGGENISSVEIQDVLYAHPDVADAAVVARPDEKWGETPCAFIELKPGSKVTEKEMNDFCRKRLAGFKRPRTYIFIDLPKTSTGKIQKFKLRERAKMLNTSSRI
eukprot:g8120.t1